jgi:hypothetical protein
MSSDEQRGMIIAWATAYDMPEKIAEKFAQVLKLLFFKTSNVSKDCVLSQLSKFDTTIQLLWLLRIGNMPKERVVQIRERAQGDYDFFVEEFDRQRLAAIEAIQHSNSYTLRNIKTPGPENHSEIFRTRLDPLYKRFDSQMRGLPQHLQDFVNGRKPQGDNWKASMNALFYYSAICAAMAATGNDSGTVLRFHSVTEKHYQTLYHIIKRDLLIAEAISLGEYKWH